jgi:hypothetical protein
VEYINELDLAIIAKCILFGETEIFPLYKYLSSDLVSNFDCIKKLIAVEKISNFMNFEYYFSINDLKIIFDIHNQRFEDINNKPIDDKVIENKCNLVIDLINGCKASNSSLSEINQRIGIRLFVKPEHKEIAEKFLNEYLSLYKQNKLIEGKEHLSFNKNLEIFLEQLKSKIEKGISINNWKYDLFDYPDIVNNYFNNNKIFETILFLNKAGEVEINKIDILQKDYLPEMEYEEFCALWDDIPVEDHDRPDEYYSESLYKEKQREAERRNSIQWSCRLSLVKKSPESIKKKYLKEQDSINESIAESKWMKLKFSLKLNAISNSSKISVHLKSKEIHYPKKQYEMLYNIAFREKEYATEKYKSMKCRINKLADFDLLVVNNGLYILNDKVHPERP